MVRDIALLLLVGVASCSLLLSGDDTPMDAGPMDAGVDGPIAPIACLPLTAFDDNFADLGAIPARWSTEVMGSSTIDPIGGRGLVFSNDGVGFAKILLKTSEAVAILDGEVRAVIEVTDAPSSFAALSLIPDGTGVPVPQNALRLGKLSSVLEWESVVGGTDHGRGPILPDANPPFTGTLGIRAVPNRVVFSSRRTPEHAAFREAMTIDYPFAETPVSGSPYEVRFEAGSTDQDAGPANTVLRRLTVETAPGDGWCSATSAALLFDDDFDVYFERLRQADGDVAVGGGVATLTTTEAGGSDSLGGILSRARYDFANTVVEFDIGPDAVEGTFFVGLRDSEHRGASVAGSALGAGNLVATLSLSEGPSGEPVTYDHSAHRYFKITFGADGSNVLFETSGDGTTWTELGQLNDEELDVSRMKIVVSVAAFLGAQTATMKLTSISVSPAN